MTEKTVPTTTSSEGNHIVNAIKMVKHGFSGKYLPLCTDKMRNNVKSRTVLALLYAVGAAMVAMVLIIAFYPFAETYEEFRWSLKPSKVMHMGVLMPSFAVSLINQDQEGVAGRKVSVVITPVGTHKLEANVNNQPFHVRDINCGTGFRSITDHFWTDMLFCSPNDFSLLPGAQNALHSFVFGDVATTNEKGLATFDNFTLALGLPTSTYVVILRLHDGAGTIMPGKELTAYVRLEAPPTTVSGVTMSDIFGSFFWANIILTPTVCVQTQYKPTVIAAAVVPLDLEKAVQVTTAVPAYAYDMEEKLALLINNVALTTKIEHVPNSSDPLLGEVYCTAPGSLRLMVEPFSLSSSNMYYGVASMGTVAPLITNSSRQPNAHPNPIQPIPSPLPKVSALNAFANPDLLRRTTTFEGVVDIMETIDTNDITGDIYTAFFVHYKIRSKRCGKMVFLHASPLPFATMVGIDADKRHTMTNPKKLYFNQNFSQFKSYDEDTKLTLCEAQMGLFFSSSGAVGLYEVKLSLDGNLIPFKKSFGDQRATIVNVITRAKKFSVSFPGAVFDESSEVYVSASTVVVGETWIQKPSVRVMQSGGDPIPGKIVTMIPREQDSVALHATSIKTDADGNAYFASVKIVSAVNTSFELQLFDFVVDNVVVGTIRQAFRYNEDREQRLLSQRTIAGELQCNAVRVVKVPSVVYHSLRSNASVELEAISDDFHLTTDPVLKTPIYYKFRFNDGTQSAPVALNTAHGRATLSFYTPQHTTLLTTTGSGPRRPIATTILVSCEESMTTPTIVVIPLIPRVTSFFGGLLDTKTFSAEIVFSALWDQTDTQDPLVVTLKPLMLPDYAISFYTSSDLEFFSERHYSNADDSDVTIRAEQPWLFEGLSPLLGVVVDGVIVGVVPRQQGNISAPTSSCDIKRSIFYDGNLEWIPSKPFPIQPVVSMPLPEGMQNNFSGAQIFAQVGVVPEKLVGTEEISQNIADDIKWINPTANASDITLALLADIPQTLEKRQSAEKLSAAASLVNGTATFQHIGIIAAIPNTTLAFRYCYSLELDAWQGKTRCAYEHRTWTVPAEFGVEFSVSPQNVVVAEGAAGEATITEPIYFSVAPTTLAGRNLRSSFAACVPTLQFPPGITKRNPLLLAPQHPWQVGLTSLYYLFTTATADSLQFSLPAGYIGLDQLTGEEGHYNLWFGMPGATRPQKVIVVVDLQPAHMYLTASSLPSVLYTTQPMEMHVAVVNSAWKPLRNINVELTFQTNLTTCSGMACGVTTGTSTLYATTAGSNGVATLQVAFAAAETAMFNLKLRVASSSSTVAVNQAFTHLTEGLMQQYGMSLSSVQLLQTTMFQQLSPNLEEIFQVITSTAAQNSKQSWGKPAHRHSSAATISSSVSHIKNEYHNHKNDVDATTTATVSHLKDDDDDNSAVLSEAAFVALDRFKSLVGSSTSDLILPHVQHSHTVEVVNVVRRIDIKNVEEVDDWDFDILAKDLSSALKHATTYSAGTIPRLCVRGVDPTTNNNNNNNNNASDELVPIPNAVVTVSLHPNTGDFTVSYPSNERTDQNGCVTFSSLSVNAFTTGEFAFHFQVRGGGGNSTKIFRVTQNSLFSLANVMKFAAASLVCVFSPVLFSTVPNSRLVYVPVATVFLLAVLALSLYFGVDFAFKIGKFFRIYTAYVLSLVSVLSVAYLIIAVMDISGAVMGKHSVRCVNDEQRALNIFRYTKWITTVIVEEQYIPVEPPGFFARQLEAMAQRFKRIRSGMKQSLEDNLSTELLQELVVVDSENDETTSSRQKLRQPARKPLWYDPQFNKKAVYIPMNFVIAVSVTISLMIGIALFLWFLHDEIILGVAQLRATLPDVADDAAASLVNDFLVTSIVGAMRTAAKLLPSHFASLQSVANNVEGLDLVGYLSSVNELLTSFQFKFSIVFGVSLSFAIFVVLATIIVMTITVPSHILEIRRGLRHGGGGGSNTNNTTRLPTYGPVEGYIGLHCMLFIILFALAFCIMVITSTFLSVEIIRVFLFNTLKVIIISSIVSVLIQMFISKFLIQRFLVESGFIVRHELYSIWHFAGLILGIFSGIAQAISRWVLSFLSISFLFAKVDNSIYPPVFSQLDKPHQAFMSIMAIEANNNNPILLVFCTILLVEKKLRSIADGNDSDKLVKRSEFSCHDETEERVAVKDQEEEEDEEEKDENEDDNGLTFHPDDFGVRNRSQLCGSSDDIHSSAIANIGRILLRFEQRYLTRPRNGSHKEFPDEDLPLNEEPSCPSIKLLKYSSRRHRIAKERVRNRWWLLWMLHKNPSLRELRKRSIVVERETATTFTAASLQVEEGQE